jgi:hypothetical protein
VLLIALNTALALGLDLRLQILGTTFTALDAVGIVIAAGMIVLLAGRAHRNLRALSEHEPAAKRQRGRAPRRAPGCEPSSGARASR